MARVTFRVFKLGPYVIVYVGRICHNSLNVRIKIKKKTKEIYSPNPGNK